MLPRILQEILPGPHITHRAWRCWNRGLNSHICNFSCSTIRSFIILHNRRGTATENKLCMVLYRQVTLSWVCYLLWWDHNEWGLKSTWMMSSHSPLSPASGRDEGRRDNLRGRLQTVIVARPRLVIANTVIKGCQWGDHRRRIVPELSQLPFRAVEIL